MKTIDVNFNDAIFLSYTEECKLFFYEDMLLDGDGRIIYNDDFSALLSDDNFIYIFSIENSHLVMNTINVNIGSQLIAYELGNVTDESEIVNVYFYNSDIAVIIVDNEGLASKITISSIKNKFVSTTIFPVVETYDLYRVYNDIELKLIATPKIRNDLEINGKIVQDYLCDRENVVCYLRSNTSISIYNIETESYLIENLDLFYPIVNTILGKLKLFSILNKSGRTTLIGIDLITNKIEEYDFEGKLEFCLLQNNKLILKHSTIEGYEFLLFENGQFEAIYKDMSEVLVNKEFYSDMFEGIHYKSNNPEKLLISLHGGPESYEFNSDTSSSLYQFALDNSIDVLVINYIGSSYSLKSELSNKNWNYVIDELVRAIEYIVDKTVRDTQNIYIYSGSFGSILGVILSARFFHDIGGHICISPLIDLRRQINKTSGSEKKWFTDKFSENEIIDLFSKKMWEQNFPYKTFIMQSPEDKVLDFHFMKSTLGKYTCFEISELPIRGHGPENELELSILNQCAVEKLAKLI